MVSIWRSATSAAVLGRGRRGPVQPAGYPDVRGRWRGASARYRRGLPSGVPIRVGRELYEALEWQRAAAQALEERLANDSPANLADSQAVSTALQAVRDVLTELNREDLLSRDGAMQGAAAAMKTHLEDGPRGIRIIHLTPVAARAADDFHVARLSLVRRCKKEPPPVLAGAEDDLTSFGKSDASKTGTWPLRPSRTRGDHMASSSSTRNVPVGTICSVRPTTLRYRQSGTC